MAGSGVLALPRALVDAGKRYNYKIVALFLTKLFFRLDWACVAGGDQFSGLLQWHKAGCLLDHPRGALPGHLPQEFAHPKPLHVHSTKGLGQLGQVICCVA
jgi:hypothetical protein